MDVCRVCLSKSPEKNISQLKTKKKQEYKSPAEIFKFCVNVEVNKNSKVTTKLCIKCYKKVINFYNFKLLALQSDAHLHSFAQISEENKVFIGDTEELLSNIKKISSSDSEISYVNFELEPEPEIKIEDINIEELQFDETLNFSSLIKTEPEAVEVEETKVEKASNIEIDSIKFEDVMKVEEDDINIEEGVRKKRGHPKSKKTSKKQVCDECGKAVADLKEHSEMHLPHELRKKISCKFCDKEFLSFGARYKHTREKHLGIRHKCDICGKEVSSLASHKARKHHPELLKHVCSFCNQRFYSASILDSHILIHTKEKPFSCDMCSKTFRTKIVMLNHKRSVHEKEKPHLCQFCSKRFFKKSHLQIHIRSHTKERPYKCEKCGRSFISQNVLKNHMATHSTSKDFHCEHCHMAFVCASYLRTHMISHTKEKKHPCKYCGVKFGRSDHRKRHEFTAHEKHTAHTQPS